MWHVCILLLVSSQDRWKSGGQIWNCLSYQRTALFHRKGHLTLGWLMQQQLERRCLGIQRQLWRVKIEFQTCAWLPTRTCGFGCLKTQTLQGSARSLQVSAVKKEWHWNISWHPCKLHQWWNYKNRALDAESQCWEILDLNTWQCAWAVKVHNAWRALSVFACCSYLPS